jgi:competence protein ComGC
MRTNPNPFGARRHVAAFPPLRHVAANPGADASARSTTARSPAQSAFTRTDLIVSLGVVALLALVILPALANQRPRSARVICANNLRQIGVGFQLWGNDHADEIPQDTALSDGGTAVHTLAPNVWLHLSWISNEVVTPSVFLCPSDTGQPARDFSASPASGYIHSNFRHRATSYFLGYFNVQQDETPAAVIAGDRNLNWDTSIACSRFRQAVEVSGVPVAAGGRWTNALHGLNGNVLSFDGRVQQLGNPELKHALNSAPARSIRKHIIIPR